MSTITPLAQSALAGKPAEAEGPRVGSAAFAEAMARYTPARVPASAREVESTRTRLTGSQAANAIQKAWSANFRETAGPRTLSILTAQWAMETGRGQAMMNYNFGGIKGTGPSGLTTACRTTEGSGPSKVSIVDHFRAYASAEEGATDYVRLLKARFPAALAAARAGDAKGFVHALKKSGYFTGSEDQYTQAVAKLSDEALTQGFDSIGADGKAGPLRFLNNVPTSTSASMPVDGNGLAAFADELAMATMRSETNGERKRTADTFDLVSGFLNEAL